MIMNLVVSTLIIKMKIKQLITSFKIVKKENPIIHIKAKEKNKIMTKLMISYKIHY